MNNNIILNKEENLEQTNAVIYASVSGTSSGITGGKESDCGSDSFDDAVCGSDET